MKTLITLLFLTAPVFADDTTAGGCFTSRGISVDVATTVSHIFNEGDVTFTSGDDSTTVSATPGGGGNRISDSATGTISGIGDFKVKDGVVQFKKEGTNTWKNMGDCAEEGLGTLPSTMSSSTKFHVPSTAGLDHTTKQQPPVIDDIPLPVI